MIACVIDNIRTEEILKEFKKYRLVFLINSSEKATRLYSKIKRTVNGIEVKVNSSDTKLLERIAIGIAKEFAEFKEPIHVWMSDKCIVF